GFIKNGTALFQGWVNPGNLSPLSGQPTAIPPGSVAGFPGAGFQATGGPGIPTAYQSGNVTTTATATGSATATGPLFSVFNQATFDLHSASSVTCDFLTEVDYTPVTTTPVAIGDFVWDDANGNGIQDSGEAGIPGVTLTLTGTDSNSTPVTDHA